MYEVHHYTLCRGWVNTWTVEETPERFTELEAARQAIADFLEDIATEIIEGNRAVDEGYDHEDFTIYDVVNQCYVEI